MALKDIIKVSRKTYFNPSSWLGYAEVKGTTRALWNIVRGLFIQETSTRVETFNEALKRLDVSEEDLQERGKDYLTYAILFVVLAIFSVVFGFYILFHHHTFAGLLLAIAAGGLFLSQAFRYHFWYFQIKSRRLGCTFQEWKEYLLGSSKGQP